MCAPVQNHHTCIYVHFFCTYVAVLGRNQRLLRVCRSKSCFAKKPSPWAFDLVLLFCVRTTHTSTSIFEIHTHSMCTQHTHSHDSCNTYSEVCFILQVALDVVATTDVLLYYIDTGCDFFFMKYTSLEQ